MNRAALLQNLVWVAHASRVLANAFRIRGLFGPVAQLQFTGKTDRKIVLAKRQNQQARRVRYLGKRNQAFILEGAFRARSAILRRTV